MFTKLIELIGKLISWFSKLSPSQKKAIIDVVVKAFTPLFKKYFKQESQAKESGQQGGSDSRAKEGAV